MNTIKEFIKETFKIFLALIALFLMIATGLGSVLLIAFGLIADWRLFALGLFVLSAWIAFINITNKHIEDRTKLIHKGENT